jgi:hypothetical protein
MLTRRSLDELEARVQFASEENVFHEHLASLNREFVEARTQGLSAEQWRAGLGYFADLSAAVDTFRSRWRSLTEQVGRR